MNQCDFFSFIQITSNTKPKKKTKMAEECSVLSDREEEALTVFCAVESIDEEDLEGVVLQGIEEIKKTAGQVNVKKIADLPVRPPLQRPLLARDCDYGAQCPQGRPRGRRVCRQAGTVRLVQVLQALVQGPPALRTLQDDRPRGGRDGQEGEEGGHPRLVRADPGRENSTTTRSTSTTPRSAALSRRNWASRSRSAASRPMST